MSKTTTHTDDRALRHSSTALHHQHLNNHIYRSYAQPLAPQQAPPIFSSAPEHYHSVQPQRIPQYSSIGSSFLQSEYRAGRESQLDYSPNSYSSNYLPLGRSFWTQSAPSWSSDLPGTHMSGATMGYTEVAPVSGFKRQRSHQRTPSASTEGSSGPDSPYTFNSSNPHIANTDLAPEYQQSFKEPALLTPDYIPRAVTTGMRAPAFDSHNIEDLSTPGSAGIMSTSDHDTPEIPIEEVEIKKSGASRAHPQLQLARTESAAYQDELYNPADLRAVTKKPAKQAQPSSTHRTLIEKRLQAAENERLQSPSLSRERSPFREGSSLSERQPFISPQGPLNHAAKRRQRIEEEQENQNALRRPQLQREPTKTISPKDALLDYTDSEQPLFQDTIPGGYQQHNGAANELLKNAILAQQNTTFTLPPSNSQTSMAGFRASTADYTNGNYNFVAPAIPTTVAATTMPFQMNYLAPAYTTEVTPDFPAHLTSMESSISEGPPMSSQESTIQRPADTRAHTGTYTCTYHGCTQRFESQHLLQRHKREYHRSQQQQRDSLSVETSSVSPRSTASPGPTGSGLTSAQILARNSQAGPHKCTRINPSTGKPCNTIFSRPYDLTRHEDTIHNGRKQKVRCPYCREEKTFSRNDALTRHLRVVHPDVESMGKRGRRGD